MLPVVVAPSLMWKLHDPSSLMTIWARAACPPRRGLYQPFQVPASALTSGIGFSACATTIPGTSRTTAAPSSSDGLRRAATARVRLLDVHLAGEHVAAVGPAAQHREGAHPDVDARQVGPDRAVSDEDQRWAVAVVGDSRTGLGQEPASKIGVVQRALQ